MVGFESYMNANRIQEWENFYLDYSAANKMLEKYIRQRAYQDMKVNPGSDPPPPIKDPNFSNQLHIHIQSENEPDVTPWVSWVDGNDMFAEFEKNFFVFLDKEFRKVCKFYKDQEAQFVYNINQLAHDLYEEDAWKKHPSVGSELQVRAKELYRGLGLIKKFCELNKMGFRKILKKHHKNSNLTGIQEKIMTEIEKSVISSPPIIDEMGRKLEHMYATNFTHGDVKLSAKALRGQEEKHGGDWTSFKVGFSVGMSFCCIILIIICFAFTPHLEEQRFFQEAFPLYRGLGLILVLMWMWAADVYLCERLHINQNNILKVDHRSYLRSVDVLHVAGALSLIYFLFAVAYFGMECFPQVKVSLKLTWVKNEVLNLVMLALVLICFLCPFPILYPKTRQYILHALRRIIFAPMYDVKFIDFFLADQLCSLVRVFDDISYSVCFFCTGSFLTRQYTCNVFSDKAKYVVAFLPYYWRVLQCFKRWSTSKDKGHLINAVKYSLSILVTLFSLLMPIYSGWATAVWIFFAVIATLASFAWDILRDWGLCEKGPGFPLRTKLRLPDKRLYYLAAVMNFFMRMAWVCTISPDFFPIRKDFLLAALSLVEILRRGMWNFFRLENEHLNNCGKFRALNILVVPHHEPVQAPHESAKAKIAQMEEHKALLEEAIDRRRSSHSLLDLARSSPQDVSHRSPNSRQSTDPHVVPAGTPHGIDVVNEFRKERRGSLGGSAEKLLNAAGRSSVVRSPIDDRKTSRRNSLVSMALVDPVKVDFSSVSASPISSLHSPLTTPESMGTTMTKTRTASQPGTSSSAQSSPHPSSRPSPQPSAHPSSQQPSVEMIAKSSSGSSSIAQVPSAGSSVPQPLTSELFTPAHIGAQKDTQSETKTSLEKAKTKISEILSPPVPSSNPTPAASSELFTPAHVSAQKDTKPDQSETPLVTASSSSLPSNAMPQPASSELFTPPHKGLVKAPPTNSIQTSQSKDPNMTPPPASRNPSAPSVFSFSEADIGSQKKQSGHRASISSEKLLPHPPSQNPPPRLPRRRVLISLP